MQATKQRPKRRPSAPSVDDAIDTIRAFVRWKGWTIYRLAMESGLGLTTLRGFNRDEWEPKTPTLRILHALIPKNFDPASAPPPEIHGGKVWHARRAPRRKTEMSAEQPSSNSSTS